MKAFLTRLLLTVFIINAYAIGISHGQTTPAVLTQIKQRLENLITVTNHFNLTLESYDDNDIPTEDASKISTLYNDIKAQQLALMFEIQQENLLNNNTIRNLFIQAKDLIDNASLLFSVKFPPQNTPEAATFSSETSSAITTDTSEYATTQVSSDQTYIVDQTSQTTNAESSDISPALFSNIALH